MNLRRPHIWFALWCFSLAATTDVQATSNPVGDEDPSVRVENGNFIIYFHNNQFYEEPPGYIRMVYSPSGKLLAPRHRRPDLTDEKYGYDPALKDEIHVGDETISFSPLVRGQPIPFYTLTKGRITEQHRLPWLEQRNFQSEAVAGDASSICMMTWSGQELALHHFDRRSFEFPKTVVIGKPLLMVSLGISPDVSNILKIGDRYCFGWMRLNDQTKKSEAVISTWKPAESKTVDSVLEEIADWNTWMSIAAIGDHVCLAYHCRFQGDYPGFGKLITVFRKIDPATGAAVPVN